LSGSSFGKILLSSFHNLSGMLSMVGCLFFSFALSFFWMKATIYQKRKRSIILSNFGIGS
jgi:hypothetical protein